MSGCDKSVKYWSIQDGVISSKVDISRVDSSPSLSNHCCQNSHLKSPEILTTPQLISAIRHLWASASRPLSFLLPKDNVNPDKITSCVHDKSNRLVTSKTTKYYSVNPRATTRLDFPTVTQKMLILKSSYGTRDYVHSLFQRVLQALDEKELGSKDTELDNLETNSLVARDCISIDTSTTSLSNESDVCNPDVLIHEASSLSNDNELKEIQRRCLSDISDNECKVQIFSAKPKQVSQSLAKQEHAFSGAMAGVCVSCCLHPVDTIKTVIQSCRAEQRSIFHIGKSIVSDRGFPGLYRGITTNIACSAPISAVYTFTYESVKAALLPYLPKEYYSLAHCVGGGCASIATSFIFTPSERIKQQMQIGSHYRNCWDALIGIIKNGGLSSLYAGWKAVLCRNIPHSMIKFYTYESLKQVMPSSSIQSHTFQTLVCGGLAGSTAALFTTPFDVIKTRLQTQIPGSRNQYGSVFHALYKISNTEGLNGLYRGLTPRLIMYMSQGSLFFASYEFFKSVFSLESPLPTGL